MLTRPGRHRNWKEAVLFTMHDEHGNFAGPQDIFSAPDGRHRPAQEPGNATLRAAWRNEVKDAQSSSVLAGTLGSRAVAIPLPSEKPRRDTGKGAISRCKYRNAAAESRSLCRA